MIKKWGFAQSRAGGTPDPPAQGGDYHWSGLTAHIHEVFGKKLIFAHSNPVLLHRSYYELAQSVYTSNG